MAKYYRGLRRHLRHPEKKSKTRCGVTIYWNTEFAASNEEVDCERCQIYIDRAKTLRLINGLREGDNDARRN